MTDNKISAVRVGAIGGQMVEEGRIAIIKVVREIPTPTGATELNLAIKAELLPTLAALCLNLMAPAQTTPGKKDRAVVSAGMIELGTTDDGQIVVTYELETKVTISFSLDSGQARLLLEGLNGLLGEKSIPPLPQTRPN